jgi:hypothetical protein
MVLFYLNLGDGDLWKSYVYQDSIVYVSQLYEAATELKATQDTIKASSDSESIAAIKVQYLGLSNDITLTTDTSLGNNDIGTIMAEWQKYTDSNVAGSYQVSCTSKTEDAWAQGQAKCPSDYKFVTGGQALANPVEKNCLTIQSWASDQVNTRYTSAPTCSSAPNTDFNSFSTAITAYYQNVKNYILENSNLLNTLTNEMTTLNDQFVTLARDLSNSIDNLDSILSPLVDLFKTTLGNNGFGQIINCSKILNKF